MMFSANTVPRIGEIARCRRCRLTWIAVTCDCGSRDCRGVTLAPAEREGIAASVAAGLTADRTSEFCGACFTEEDRFALHMRERAYARGEAGN